MGFYACLGIVAAISLSLEPDDAERDGVVD